MWNRVTANRSKHKTTWFYIDEFHLLLKGQTGSFSVEIWKRFRKWGGISACCGIISNLEYRFYKAYGMEIEDKRTVYGECTYRLVPREDEPSVCLMHDWIYLPSA